MEREVTKSNSHFSYTKWKENMLAGYTVVPYLYFWIENQDTCRIFCEITMIFTMLI